MIMRLVILIIQRMMMMVMMMITIIVIIIILRRPGRRHLGRRGEGPPARLGHQGGKV